MLFHLLMAYDLFQTLLLKTDVIFSDGHALLNVDINLKQKYMYYKNKPQNRHSHFTKWNENKKKDFISNINADDILNIQTELDRLLLNQSIITKDVISLNSNTFI